MLFSETDMPNSVSQWSEDKIELEYKLRNEYFEGGGANETYLCNPI